MKTAHRSSLIAPLGLAVAVLAGGSLSVQAQNALPTTGYVGVGTATPIEPLDVKIAPNFHFGVFGHTPNATSIGAFNDGFTAWQPLSINPGSQVWFMGGNVGIGTTNPSAKLCISAGTLAMNTGASIDLSGQGAFTGNYTQLITRLVRVADGGDWTTAALQLLRRTDVTDQASISLYRDNVGIGTNVPVSKLTIYGQSRDPSLATDNGVFTLWGTNTAQLSIGSVPASPFGLFVQTKSAFNDGGTSYPLLLNPLGGNVGIGTAAPALKFSILATGVNDGISVSNNSGAFLRVFAGTTANGSYNPLVGERDNAIIYCGGDLNNGGSPSALVIAPWSGSSGGIRMDAAGNVGIGIRNPTNKLEVNGTIRTKEVIVETTGWSDYVFAPDYRLAPLSEVEAAIKAEGHLPGIPSAAEVAEHGVSLGDMQAKLLAKMEEMTLHQIAQEKEIQRLRAEVADLRKSNQ